MCFLFILFKISVYKDFTFDNGQRGERKGGANSVFVNFSLFYICILHLYIFIFIFVLYLCFTFSKTVSLPFERRSRHQLHSSSSPGAPVLTLDNPIFLHFLVSDFKLSYFNFLLTLILLQESFLALAPETLFSVDFSLFTMVIVITMLTGLLLLLLLLLFSSSLLPFVRRESGKASLLESAVKLVKLWHRERPKG